MKKTILIFAISFACSNGAYAATEVTPTPPLENPYNISSDDVLSSLSVWTEVTPTPPLENPYNISSDDVLSSLNVWQVNSHNTSTSSKTDAEGNTVKKQRTSTESFDITAPALQGIEEAENKMAQMPSKFIPYAAGGCLVPNLNQQSEGYVTEFTFSQGVAASEQDQKQGAQQNLTTSYTPEDHYSEALSPLAFVADRSFSGGEKFTGIPFEISEKGGEFTRLLPDAKTLENWGRPILEALIKKLSKSDDLSPWSTIIKKSLEQQHITCYPSQDTIDQLTKGTFNLGDVTGQEILRLNGSLVVRVTSNNLTEFQKSYAKKPDFTPHITLIHKKLFDKYKKLEKLFSKASEKMLLEINQELKSIVAQPINFRKLKKGFAPLTPLADIQSKPRQNIQKTGTKRKIELSGIKAPQ